MTLRVTREVRGKYVKQFGKVCPNDVDSSGVYLHSLLLRYVGQLEATADPETVTMATGTLPSCLVLVGSDW